MLCGLQISNRYPNTTEHDLYTSRTARRDAATIATATARREEAVMSVPVVCTTEERQRWKKASRRANLLFN
jgi:hypothetical protein